MDNYSYSTKGVCSRKIEFTVEDGIITDAHFTGGCNGNTQGVAALVKGMTVEEALKVTNKKVIECLGGLPSQKIHCSVLAEEAIKKANEDYLAKRA